MHPFARRACVAPSKRHRNSNRRGKRILLRRCVAQNEGDRIVNTPDSNFKKSGGAGIPAEPLQLYIRN
jgi:hypothetical protein